MSGLSVRGLTARRGARLVLEDVSFSAPAGAITAILGEAGSGKTSLLACIAGLLPAERGAVLAGGEDVSGRSARRRGVAFLAPGTELPASRKLGDALRRLAGRKDAALGASVAASLGMDGLASRIVGQLGHGEGLLALAAARILGARGRDAGVLLIDEAGSGLNPGQLARLLEMLRGDLVSPRAIVLATRDPAVALRADHLVLLHEGRVLQASTPASVYAEPRCAVAARLTGRANILHGKVRELRPGAFQWSGSGWSAGRFVQAMDGETARPQLGAQVAFSLRPERMVLLGAGQAAGNALEATVEDVRSAGPLLEAVVMTAAGRLVVACPSWRPSLYPSAGQSLVVAWGDDAATVLLGEQAA